MTDTAPVIIVGAGMAGLGAALRLQEAGKEVRVLEAAEAVGGRIRTDEVDGFLIDRGFQVYLDAYPTAGQVLDLEALDLRPFEPGALVWRGGRMHRLMDVFRRPGSALSTAFSCIGSLSDKLRTGLLRIRALGRELEAIESAPDLSTVEFLREQGFSPQMIDGFFRAFYGGIFLERELRTSSRMFEFTFRMFAKGSATVPAGGMQRIPEQLAGRLAPGVLSLGTEVKAVRADGVSLADGRDLEAAAVVVATDAHAAARLVPEMAPEMPAWRAEVNFAFAAESFPLQEAIIALNGESHGVVNNVCNLSAVSPAYAPPGQDLVIATVLGDSFTETLEQQVRAELSQWFDCDASRWKLLRRDRIPHALPEQLPGVARPGFLKSDSGIWLAGDHCQSASIEGALVSGRKVAEKVGGRVPTPTAGRPSKGFPRRG